MIAVGDITHYLGDTVCLVAAESPEILAQAKTLVKVDYEELPAVHSPRRPSCRTRRWCTGRAICWPISTSSGETRRRRWQNPSIS